MNKYKTIEIYFGKRKLFLTDKIQDFYFLYENRKQLKEIIANFRTSNEKELYICSKNLNELFINFKSIFVYEEAAGGLVINRSHQVLAIRNRDIWQLPKGHVEEGETYAEAAVREVMEECGISEPGIINELPSTYHTFSIDGRWFLKRTYWFRMLYKGIDIPKPQTEEGITHALWIDKKDLWLVYDTTYENLIQIWDLA